MGATLNGMALHGGLLPFGGTFLIFSDYMRPSIRLAALMKLKVVYVFTHDSIGVGEDGPTHQPIEQLASLRVIPGLTVIRPGDASETAEAWRVAVSCQGPVALVLTRQKLPILDRTKYGAASGLNQGGYVLSDCKGSPQLILLATGSEVSLALEAQEKLESQGVATRVVSLPSWELFDQQSKAVQEEVLPSSVTARLSVEAAHTQGWARYVGTSGDSVGMERFGASAPSSVAMKEFGFTVENVVSRALKLIKGGRS
jgi:transketolase